METPRDLPETPRHQLSSYNKVPTAPKLKRKIHSNSFQIPVIEFKDKLNGVKTSK